MEKGNIRRILLVEDDEEIAGMLHDLLKERGFEVLYFVNAADALKYADNAQSIDVALIDMMDDLSPSVSGIDISRKVRTNNPHAKIFIMSGVELDSLSIVKHLIEKKELQGYMEKPFSFREVKDLITLAEN